MSRRPDGGRVLTRAGCALGLALLAAAFAWPVSAADGLSQFGSLTMSAASEIVVAKPSADEPSPAALRVGFTSDALDSPAVPGLTRIELEISRNLSLQTAGLPSCPLADLYSTYPSARQSCAGSFVGHGSVTSEVTLPGQAPVIVNGRLLAFYSLAGDEPYVLAQVTSGDPLPLTYVIPFQIAEAHGVLGTSLVVPQMRAIAGRCGRGHPNCFAQPYTLKGIYGHISNFEMSLRRSFAHAGERESFVNARCPAPGKGQEASFPLTRTSLHYTDGSTLTAVVNDRCRASSE